MMEAVRALGFAARFVTGYLYDPALDGGPPDVQGAGATHAWVQVYLPGAGWVEFDPTNGIVGGRNLIRVGVARDPRQAIPLTAPSSARATISSISRRRPGEAGRNPATVGPGPPPLSAVVPRVPLAIADQGGARPSP